MSEDKLHPLEVLALGALPWKARVSRLANSILTGKLDFFTVSWRNLHPKEAKRVVAMIQEPWGKKGRLAKELIAEHERQREVLHKRERRQIARHSCRMTDYDPTRGFRKWSTKDRVNAIVRLRIGDGYQNGLDKTIRWSRNNLPCRNFRDARICRGAYFAVMLPSEVCVEDRRTRRNYTWHTEHKIRYLFYRVGEAAGAIRIPHKVGTVAEAIESLKNAAVRKAEEKNYAVEIDWQALCFRVKSPRRRKWREIPFKQAKRKKRR